MSVSADLSRLVSGSRDHTIRVWDVCAGGTCVAMLTKAEQGHSAIITVNVLFFQALCLFGTAPFNSRLLTSLTYYVLCYVRGWYICDTRCRKGGLCGTFFCLITGIIFGFLL